MSGDWVVWTCPRCRDEIWGKAENIDAEKRRHNMWYHTET